MQTVNMYYVGCTRKNRFSSQSVLHEFLENNEPTTIQVEGCIISESTGYFDFTDRLQVKSSYLDLMNFSYLQIKMNDGNTNPTIYYAFVDKFEVNNFNGESFKNTIGNYYRCYFTIDWWTTILENNPNELVGITADSTRGHINDIRYFGGKFVPQLEHTAGVEEEISGYSCYTKRLPTEPDDLSWVYIILDPVDELGRWKEFNQYVALQRELSCCTALIACLPVRNGIVEPYIVINVDEQGNGTTVAYEVKGANANYPVTAITDEQVLGIFYSTIPPCRYEILTPTDPTNPKLVITKWAYNTKYFNGKCEIETIDLDIYKDLTAPALLCQYLTGMYVDGDYIKDILPEGLSVLNPKNEIIKPTTYYEYLFTQSKFYSSIYSPLLLRGGNAYDVIDFTQKLSPLDYIDIQISVGNGGIFSHNPTIYNTDLSGSTKIVGDNNIFMPVKIVDKTDTYKAIANGFQKITAGIVGTAGGVVTGQYDKAINSYMKGYVGGISDTAFNLIENAKGSDTGYTNAQPHDYTMSEVEFEYYYPKNYSTILERLALYGYFTDIQPSELLSSHKRKYFNYIKTNNCVMNNVAFAEVVRKDIENMFNSGVWLWNTITDFGNYEVPNYPILMDEVDNV